MGLRNLYNQFICESEKLELILDLLRVPKTLERDLYIKGVFLQTVINWENFIEECFLSAMCKCKTINKSIVRPKISISKNKNEAFKTLINFESERNCGYLDWLNHSKIKKKVEKTFHHNSRFHVLYKDCQTLNQLQTIRNHIAHNSKKSKKEFETFLINEFRYIPPSINDVSDFIISKTKNNQEYYKKYIIYYREIAKKICL